MSNSNKDDESNLIPQKSDHDINKYFEQASHSLQAAPLVLTELGEREPRQRKLTDKGREYQLELLKSKRQTAYSVLNNHVQLVNEAIKNKEVRLEILENRRDTLDILKEEFNDSHKALQHIIVNELEKQESYQWFDIRDRGVMECRLRLVEFIQALEKKIYQDEAVSNHSKSNKSTLSSRASSIRSRRLDAASKTARLKTEAAFLDNMIKQERQMRHLKLQKEIAVSEAEEKSFQKLYEEEIVGKENVKYESQDYGILGSTSRFPPFINADIDEERKDSSYLRFETKIDLSAPTPKAKFEEHRPVIHSQTQAIPSNLDTWNETLKQLTAIQGMQTQLSSLIASQQKIQHLPIKEPPLFSGDVFDYSSFITAFDFIISDNVASDKDRLYFLAKYTTRKAHEVIQWRI